MLRLSGRKVEVLVTAMRRNCPRLRMAGKMRSTEPAPALNTLFQRSLPNTWVISYVALNCFSQTTHTRTRKEHNGFRGILGRSRARKAVCILEAGPLESVCPDDSLPDVHLSALLEHPNISSLKPAATQISLQKALREQASTHLELSEDGYFVRRRPSTYPLHFVPSNSFDVVNDEGLSFWDQRTIYVEPHTRDLCKTPAKVAYWIKEHSQMRDKWLPVQAVHTLYNSCAFVVLSGNVMHQGTWQKWRALDKPEFWKIITKTEHTKRSEEYVNLLKEEKAMSKQAKSHSTSPQTNPPADLAETTTMTTPAESNELVGDKRPAQEDAEQATRKRKRGKKKKKEGRAVTGEAFEAETPVNGLSGEQDLDDDVANRSRSADRGNEATIPHDAKTARLEQKNTQERENTSSIG